MLTREIYTKIDSRRCLAKALDILYHGMLLLRLESGPALFLFTSYLQNKKQQVAINEAKSKFQIGEHGVPQGIVLGPILFSICLNSVLKQKYTGSYLSKVTIGKN